MARILRLLARRMLASVPVLLMRRGDGELIAMAPMWHQVFGHLGTPDEAGNAINAARDELQTALALCVRAIDNLLPGAAHIPADIGLINEALLKARPLVGDV